MEITWTGLIIFFLICLALTLFLADVNSPNISDERMDEIVSAVHLGKPFDLSSNPSDMELRMFVASVEAGERQRVKLVNMKQEERELALQCRKDFEDYIKNAARRN